MSGKSVTARTSITPQDSLVASPISSRPIAVRCALRAPSQPTTYRARIVDVSPGSACSQRDRHRADRSPISTSLDVQAVERAQPAGRALHVIEQVGEHPRLVDDHVRELRQPLLDVLDAPGARDLRSRSSGSGRQKLTSLTQYASSHQPIGEPERLEHLHGAAGDAVGLADLERPVPAIDDRGPDVGEVGQLRRQDQAGRTAADDQDVDLLGQAARAAPRRTDAGPRRTGRRSRSR